MPSSFLESYDQIRKLCMSTGNQIADLVANSIKKDYFFKHLKKFTANEYVPPEYNDDVKCVLVALHMSGLGEEGDELQHVPNLTKALKNGFDPENLPELYKNEIQKLSGEEKGDIFEQCQNTPHRESICNLLFPEFSNTAGNEYSATVGDGSIAAGYDAGSAEEHDVGISGNVPFGLD
ncbi:MAG: hypothetical protein LN569_04000 [Rickettsia endosymbiont of Labidopullus appendiculatus]|nr:hypothetical protein [Rickettsia endosymbiont of Labidopullus appendiculatus]